MRKNLEKTQEEKILKLKAEHQERMTEKEAEIKKMKEEHNSLTTEVSGTVCLTCLRLFGQLCCDCKWCVKPCEIAKVCPGCFLASSECFQRFFGNVSCRFRTVLSFSN